LDDLFVHTLQELAAAFETVADEPTPRRLSELARELEAAAQLKVKNVDSKLH
jgi:hypothetical protein